MKEEEIEFHKISEKIKDSVKSKLFGKLSYKINKKAFVCYYKDQMVFKLTGEVHQEAINLTGSQLFDPSQKNRPMKEWVQVPYTHNNKWKKFAENAAEYVSTL